VTALALGFCSDGGESTEGDCDRNGTGELVDLGLVIGGEIGFTGASNTGTA
jgi:hypothetical protein